MGKTYCLICKHCGNEFIGKSPRTFYCDNCYEYRYCKKCNQISNKKFLVFDEIEYVCNSCVRKEIAIKTSKQRIKSMKRNGTFEKFQKAGTEAALKVWNNKTEEEKLKQLENAHKKTQEIWDNYSEEERLNRITPMIKAMQERWDNLPIEKRNEHLIINKGPGICSICKEWNEERDQNARGVSNCKCSQKWFLNNGFCPNFIQKDDILYYYDKIILDYVPWKEFKSKFKVQNVNFHLPKGFKLYPTFRTQESTDWSNARSAFEQSLVDEGIEWFIYIKFYTNKDSQILPLVVGKSGSLLVNNNGSDISFSMDINDGPARRFLNEEDLQWNKTQIAICKCESEEKAFELESKLKKKLDIFGS